MALDCDQHAADKLFPMPVKNQPNILANVLGAHVIQAELNDTGQNGATLEKQPCKIKILCQNHGAIFSRPAHHFCVRGVGGTQLTPMADGVSVLTEKFDPGKRQTIINDNGHAG